MEEADELCNRVAIMDHGRILALDTPRGLKLGVGADTVVTVKVTTDAVRFEQVLADQLEGVTRTRQVDGAIEAHVMGASQLLPKVIRLAESAGVSIADLSVNEPSLETVFINLTGKDLRD
jgi:ABC-2 type transport system ATP-binding protein